MMRLIRGGGARLAVRFKSSGNACQCPTGGSKVGCPHRAGAASDCGRASPEGFDQRAEGRFKVPLIPTTWVDTAPLPVGDQFCDWAAHGVASIYHPVQPGPFRAQGAFWNLGSAVVTKAEVDPFVAVRDAAQVAERSFDHVQLVALIDGSALFETDKGLFDCHSPGLFLCDYRRHYRITSSRTRMASVYMARSFLEEVAGPVSVHGPLRHSAEGVFLATILAAIDNVLPFAAASSAPYYARMLRELTAATIDHQRAPGGAKDDRGLRHRVEASIMAAATGHIDIAALCVSEGISRSTLYRLFRRDGGVLSWDRTRRLRDLYRSVSDPADTRTLGEIGAAHGFHDSAGLARAFKLHFGMSASQVRQRAWAGAAPHDDGDTAFDQLRRSVAVLSS